MRNYIIYSMFLMLSVSCMHAASENMDEKALAKKMIAKQLSEGFEAGDLVALKKIFDAFQHATDAQRTYR